MLLEAGSTLQCSLRFLAFSLSQHVDATLCNGKRRHNFTAKKKKNNKEVEEEESKKRKREKKRREPISNLFYPRYDSICECYDVVHAPCPNWRNSAVESI